MRKKMKKEMKAKKEEPEPIEMIIKRWFVQSGLDKDFKKYKVFAAWNQSIDDVKVKEHVYPIRFVAHVLEIGVDSPIYHFELVNFQKKNLLEKVQQNCEIYVKDIRFICDGKIKKSYEQSKF